MTDLTPDSHQQQSQQELRHKLSKLARLLDSAVGIPGTRIRIGLDALIGLVPGIGDLAGLGLGLYLIWQARSLRAPGSVQLKMLGNLGLEALIGAVPVLGDVFDVFWQANTKNIRLLEAWSDTILEQPQQKAEPRHRWILAALLSVLALGLLLLWQMQQG